MFVVPLQAFGNYPHDGSWPFLEGITGIAPVDCQ